MTPSKYRPPEDIPLIDGLPAAGQQQLQIFLRRQFLRLAEDLAAATRNDAPTVVYTDTRLDVPAGAKRRVTPPLAGMKVVLEAPSQFNAGEEIVLFLEAPRGTLIVTSAPGVDDGGKVFLPQVNGARQATYTAAGVITLRSNGSTAWSSPAEIPAESPASFQQLIVSTPGATGANGAKGAAGATGAPAPPAFCDIEDGPSICMPIPQMVRQPALYFDTWTGAIDNYVLPAGFQSGDILAITLSGNATLSGIVNAASNFQIELVLHLPENGAFSLDIPNFSAGTTIASNRFLIPAQGDLELSDGTIVTGAGGSYRLKSGEEFARIQYFGQPGAGNWRVMAGTAGQRITGDIEVAGGSGGVRSAKLNQSAVQALVGVPQMPIDEDGPLLGMPGPPGLTGANGTNGNDGQPGAPAAPFQIEDDGIMLGMPGVPGVTGAIGAAGTNAAPGSQFPFDEDGPPMAMPAPPGANGATGATGANGNDGASGAPSPPLAIDDDGFSFSLPGPPGAAGVAGGTGATGAAGTNAAPATPFGFEDEGVPFSMPFPTSLPVINPGSFIGLQITAAGATTAIEITGAESGQNIRFNTWATSTAVGNQADFAVAASTTGIGLTPATLLNLQGLAMAAVPTQGELLILSPQNTSALVTLEHASASEATAARKFQNPGQLNLSLFQNENALIINDSNAGRMRVLAMGRARSAVQANSGTISPAETLNFITTPTTGTVVPTLAVAAGVMGLSYELLSATQSQLDNATVTTNPCVPSLLGFRPGLTSLTAKATVSAGTGRNQVGNYTIPLGSPVAGSTYLIWGYMTYVRGATATAHGLIFEVLLNSSVVETLTTIPAAVGSGSYGGLAFCLLTIYTTGTTGTCSIQTTVLNQYRAGAAFGFDTSFSTATVAINTTGVGNPFQLSVKMDAMVAATSTNWTNAGCMRIN